MRQFLSILLMVMALGAISTTTSPFLAGDNYQVTDKSRTNSGYEYEVKCTDCGKYITIYYKNKTGKYAQGDSPWYTQYRSISAGASKGCYSRCD